MIRHLLAFVVVFFLLAPMATAVDFANINVVENDTANNTTSVTVTIDPGQSTPDFTIRSGSNRGDFNVQIGATHTDDFAGGVLVTSISQNGVDHGNGNGFQIGQASVAESGGGYFVPVHQSTGVATASTEYNSNFSAMYFPYAEGWIGGVASVSTNGGPITSVTGNARLGVPDILIQEGFNGYTGTVDGVITQNNNTGDFSSGSQLMDGGSDTREGLFRFDNIIGNGPNQIAADANVLAAGLILTSDANGTGGPWTVHQLLSPFDQTATYTSPYGPNGPQEVDGYIGPATGSFGAVGASGVGIADITAAVKNWQAGQPNYGLNVKPGTSDGWVTFHSETGTVSNRPAIGVILDDGSRDAVILDGGGGQFQIVVPNHNSRTDGVMMVNHAKNEGNYAMVEAAAGGSFVVRVHDLGTDASSYEQDPFAFAYIPLGTENVTMGTINGQGGALLGQGDYSVQEVSNGVFQLEIAGETNTTGTLMVTGHAGGSVNIDNIVTFQPNGTGWEIQTRDLPGAGLQDVGADPAFSFAFMSFANPPTAPGADPTSPFNPNAVAGGNVVVTEFNPGNEEDSMFARVDVGSRGFGTFSSNRGDNTLAFGGEGMSVAGGVLLATISQNSRDNSATGGLTDIGAVAAPNGSTNYVVSTFTDAVSNAEHNVNFNAVYFPDAAGFDMAANVAIPGGTTTLNTVMAYDPVSMSQVAVDARSDGILIANGFGNDDNVASVGISASGFDIRVMDNSSSLEGDAYSYVFVPFGTENLTAGRIGDGGEIEARAGDFTITREGTGLYRLSIEGQSAQTGALLLTATHDGNSADNTLTFEADGNDFLIQGLDLGSTGFGAQDTGFGFVFSPYDTPLANPQLRVFDDAAVRKMNVAVTQNDTGNSTSSVSVVTSGGGDFLTIGGHNKGDFDPYINGIQFNPQEGILLATIAENGRDNGDGDGTVYGIVGVEHNNNGTTGFIAVDRIVSAGGPVFGAETNIDLSVAYFPFASGVIGSHAASDGTLYQAGQLPAGSTLTNPATGTYNLDLSGINSEKDGVLFAINGSNADNTWAAVPNVGGSGWSLYSYDNQATSGTDLQNEDFSFLYLPMEVNAQVAAIGNVEQNGGYDGAGEFMVTRLGVGEYLIDATFDEMDDAILLLSLSEQQNAALSFEEMGGDFLVQARLLGSDDPALVDVEFGFALLAAGGVAGAASSSLPEPASLLVWTLLGLAAAYARRFKKKK